MKKIVDKTANRPKAVKQVEEKSNPMLLFALESLRRWWKVCFPVGLVLAAVSCFAIWFFFEPVYQSRAVIRIAQSEPRLLGDNRGGGNSLRNQNSFVQNEIALIQSPIVLRPVLRDTEVLAVPELAEANDQEKALARMLSIKSAGGSELYYITAECKDPDDAKLVCDKVTDAYFQERQSFENNLLSRMLTILETEGDRSKSNVEDLERELRLLLEQSEDILNSQLMNAVDENSEDKFDRPMSSIPLINLQIQFESESLRRINLQNQIAEQEDEVAADEIVFNELEVQALVDAHGTISNLEMTIRRETIEYETNELGRDHPEMKRLAESIERNERMLEEQRVLVEEQVRAQMEVTQRENRRLLLEQLERDLSTVESNMETLNEKISSHSETIADANQQALSIEFKRYDLARAKEIRERLEERLLLLKTESGAPERITRADPPDVGATLPNAPVEAIPLKPIGAATLLCLGLPFAIAFLWEVRAKRISSSEQIEQQLNQTLVGEVAVLPTRGNIEGKSSSKRIEKQFRLFEESVDSLRTIFTVSSDQDYQLVSVTSAAPNEGKTTVASQLAISLGRVSKQPVLLIDGDVRAPDLHYIFGLENEVGLVDVLLEESKLEDAIQPAIDENLHVLPAGELRGESPHRVLDPERLEALVEQLREKYDHIVFDTSPVLSSSESLHVSRCCDATIVSVMRDISRVDQVKKVSERLESSGINMAGMVLSGVPQYKYSYSYGAYGDYA